MDYDLYIESYFEWLKYMIHLGPYISIGFKDLNSKANTMQENRQLFNEKLKLISKNDKEYKYICHFV